MVCLGLKQSLSILYPIRRIFSRWLLVLCASPGRDLLLRMCRAIDEPAVHCGLSRRSAMEPNNRWKCDRAASIGNSTYRTAVLGLLLNEMDRNMKTLIVIKQLHIVRLTPEGKIKI